MANNQSNGINSKLKEANVYLDQGLLEEAAQVLKQLENLIQGQDIDVDLKTKVKKLKEELEKRQQEIKDTVQPVVPPSNKDQTDLGQLYEEAQVFLELGLYQEALEGLKSLVLNGFNVKEVLPKLLKCFDALNYKNEASDFFDFVLKQQNISNLYKDLIRWETANFMERNGIYVKAFEYYKAITTPQLVEKVKPKIRQLASKVKGGSRYSYLLQTCLQREQLEEAIKEAKQEEKSVEYILIRDLKIPKEEVAKSLSIFYECSFISFSKDYNPPLDLIHNLKKEYLINNIWFPVKKNGNKVIVVIDDPGDFTRTDAIRAVLNSYDLNLDIELAVGIKEEIIDLIEFYFGSGNEKIAVEFKSTTGESIESLVESVEFETEEEGAEEDVTVTESDSKVVKFVNKMILDAHAKKASDIHLEPSPSKKETNIRFRIDGVCQPYITIPNVFAKAVVSRIKIISNLDIAERRLPQDGKIKFKHQGKVLVELRVATLPTVGGNEDVVMRLLHTGKPLPLTKLGMTEVHLEKFKQVITQPYGLILVVGPTGSGKTTTLHSALSYINTPKVKIWTAEDPVEITQEGLRQVEVKPKIGLTFARVLRAFLRADPDVIMVGEMRDEETASIGIEASLTGHLVFSTLHTNSAPETVTRLLEMGLDPHNFADSFLGVLAQRLMRKLCTHCKEGYHPSQKEFEEYVEEYGPEQFKRLGLTYNDDLILYRPKGCEQCGKSGYKGRIGIHELLINTVEIQELIKQRASTEKIRQEAIQKNGMTTLKQDGMLKFFQGITDIKEVRRVCIK